jgi:subtilase-type serine protease
MNMDVRIKPAPVGMLLLVISAGSEPAAAAWLDTGTLGDPASWRSAEFQRDWGLTLAWQF